MRLHPFLLTWVLLVAAYGCHAASDGPDGSSSGSNLDDRFGPNAGTRSDPTGREDGGEEAGALLPFGDSGSASSLDGGGAGASGMSDAGSALDGSSGQPDGSTAACDADAIQCSDGKRERCDAGRWVSDACPLTTPACVQAECVLRGPSLVRVGVFYVDSTEVTIDQYQTFLDDVGSDIPAQPEVCAWNTQLYDGVLSDPGTWPITWVDWCDARAYCDWAGKHLCGAIEGGAVAAASALDQAESQWFLACGGTGGSSHPNDSPDCNSTGGSGNLDPVGSNAGCEGWNPGVFDLEGNAAEWVDSCNGDTGSADLCLLLGGSYLDNQSYCTESFDEFTRDTTAAPFGFRCCSG